MINKISLIDSPGLSDKDRDHLRDGFIERVTDIVREQTQQLIDRMTAFGMDVKYKVEPRYGHVELTIMVKRVDTQGLILSRTFSTEIYTAGRGHAIGAVRYDLENMVRTLFFSEVQE